MEARTTIRLIMLGTVLMTGCQLKIDPSILPPLPSGSPGPTGSTRPVDPPSIKPTTTPTAPVTARPTTGPTTRPSPTPSAPPAQAACDRDRPGKEPAIGE